VRWQALSPAQREALAPLEREWPSIDAQRKQKWLQIADRYPSLPPQEQARIAERMIEWARLTPAQRGEMRLRYQESQQVPDRSAKWQEYQNLPPESRQQFADRAAAASPPARPDPSPAPRRLLPDASASQAKANVVPNPNLAERPKSVAPTVVQAAPGRDHALRHPPRHAAGAPAVGHAQDHGDARVHQPLHPAAQARPAGRRRVAGAVDAAAGAPDAADPPSRPSRHAAR
jgi:hypothetical protein